MFKQFIKIFSSTSSVEDTFHKSFNESQYLKILWVSGHDTFKHSTKRLISCVADIKDYLSHKNLPTNSISYVIDEITSTCKIYCDHRYIGADKFMKIFHAGTGALPSKRKLAKTNLLWGFLYSLYYIPIILYKIVTSKPNSFTPTEKNITLNKIYKIKIHSSSPYSSRSQVIHHMMTDILSITNKDKLFACLPIPFSQHPNISNNIGVGLCTFNKNDSLKDTHYHIINGFKIGFVTNALDVFLNFLSIKAPISGMCLRKKLNVVFTMFYYDGTGDSNTDFKLNFIPGKNVIEEMYIGACAVRSGNTVIVTTNVTTRSEHIAVILNKNGDFKYYDI